MDHNPFAAMRKCGARTRTGGSCRRIATHRGRCRLHGGAEGTGAPFGEANGRYTHGRKTHIALSRRSTIAVLLREVREALLEHLDAADHRDPDAPSTPPVPVDRTAALTRALDALLPAARAAAWAEFIKRAKS